MSAINKALKKCEKLSDEDRIKLFVESFGVVNRATNAILKDEAQGFLTTMQIVFLSIAADGKFDEKEYGLLSGMLKAAIDKDYNYSEAKALVESAGSPDEQIDFLRKYFLAVSDVSEDAGVSFICLMMTTLAIDGDVSYSEKKWMNKIF